MLISISQASPRFSRVFKSKCGSFRGCRVDDGVPYSRADLIGINKELVAPLRDLFSMPLFTGFVMILFPCRFGFPLNVKLDAGLDHHTERINT